jgi:hypothetical protein
LDKQHFFGAALALELAAASASAATLVAEPFNYATGDLHLNVAPNGNTWYSSATNGTADRVQVVSGSLSYPGLAPSTGNSVSFGDSGRTDRLAFTSQNSGTVYYSFLLNITDLTSTAATGGAIVGFNNTAQTSGTDDSAANPTNIVTRTVIKPITGNTTYQIGLNKVSGTAGDFLFDSGTFNINQTYLIVGSYTFIAGLTNDESKLWVNPSAGTFGAGSAPATVLSQTLGTDNTVVATFILRQIDNIVPSGVQIDELRVGTTWADVTPVPEPTAISALALATAGMMARRARRAYTSR